MKTKWFAGVLMLVAAFAAEARADDDVDRERLEKALMLPSVGPRGWYYVMSPDGRVIEGGEEPEYLDVAVLRARIKGDDSDLDRWRDLAAAHRRLRNLGSERECRANAVVILRKQAAAHPDDGRVHAALGQALSASGDDAGAAASIATAERAPANAWAGAAAAADALVVQATARVAGRRFPTLDDATGWIGDHRTEAPALDGKLLDSASTRYDDAVAGIEKSGATGRVAASVLLRRHNFRGILELKGTKRSEASDYQRALLDLLTSDPYAVTLTALGDAMSEPSGADGSQVVQTFEKLPDTSRAKLAGDMARLEALAASPDAETSARAFQGVACILWFVHRDGAATEAALRKSIARSPRVEQSWNALVMVLAQSQRWDDLAKLSAEWMKTGATAKKRMVLAKALAMNGVEAEAQMQWRWAWDLDPRGFETNVGVAVFLMRRAQDESELRAAAGFLNEASAGLLAKESPSPQDFAVWRVANAALLGLEGHLDDCERAARRILELDPSLAVAGEILAAIGR